MPDQRLYPIPSDWEGEFCKFAICWPDSPSWRALLRGLVSDPCRGYFWNGDTGSVIDTLEVIRQTENFNSLLEEVIMSCSDLTIVADAIRALAAAQASCCGGSSGQGGSWGAGQEDEPASDVIDDAEGDPPPGFEDWESYHQYKCIAAYWIVEQIAKSLSFASSVNWDAVQQVDAVINLLTIFLAIEVPYLLIITLASALLLLATEIIQDFCETVQDRFEDAQMPYVCALYNASSVGNAILAYKQVTEDIVLPSLGFDAARITVARVIINTFANNSALNRLFEADPLVGTDDLGDACDGCQNCVVEYNSGTGFEGWSTNDDSFGAGSSSGSVNGELGFELVIASSPAGVAQAIRLFEATVADVLAGGWSGAQGARIEFTTSGSEPGIVGYGAAVLYPSDPDQYIPVGSIGEGSSPDTYSFVLSGNDASEVIIAVGNTRTAFPGTGTSNNSGSITSVRFCN